MYARVVRFTDVTPERIAEIKARVEESDGPPPGVESSGMMLLSDASQGTAIFVGYFDDEGKMRDADAIFQAMDADDTPGNRASIDQCEVVLERDA
jgi:hypothetical protein